MTTAISIQDLEWKYEHTTEFALRKVSLEIEEHAFVGIVGANEQGKTSLISCISGLIPHSHNGIYRGAVQVFGREVKDQDALDLATQVGIVFADPEAQFTAMTVEEELVFGLENMGFDMAAIHERLAWAAEVTMIESLLDKSPYDVSGGQKQRVAIACVLAMNPPIIIMDEPTSMIDPLGKNFIFDILRRLKDAGEHTLIVVEHNIEQLAPLSDKMVLMHEGNVARVATPAEFFNEPEFLIDRGIATPEIARFSHWLRAAGYSDPDAAPPYDLEDGVQFTRRAIERARIQE